ncbi:MotA/TolQ/ExbB proton channel family protein [Rhodoferax sp. GW822-FHT02A01]|jgi:biopolymer transport protein ExbB|uniref:MotA/TolQ/ExbB proton channel family protein n=1 Tax=Rhodoferax sp. GW822-FHT02A01 TaxID=3141537 RepID=UPI00315DFC29
MNPTFGLVNVWMQGDAVSRVVLLVLLAMSLASWLVIGFRLLDLRRLSRQAAAIESFWHAKDFAEGIRALGPVDSPFVALAQEGQKAATHLTGKGSAQAELHEGFDFSDWVTRSLRNSVDDSTARMQSGLAILASAGSTAPFVGLFGTVWGIYHALMSIGMAGQATIDKVAGPIGEALIMTALGLAVAIPAVLGYNALVRANKAIIAKLNRFAHDLHAYFVTGARVGSGKHT